MLRRFGKHVRLFLKSNFVFYPFLIKTGGSAAVQLEGRAFSMATDVRSRFAPSPTGFMHVGNLRTALYEYLIARSQGGKFILRLEDTDRERLVEGAERVIYNTLQTVGLQHDEGPDIGGPVGPYIQSERLAMYKPYAEQLVREGKAYYCFCTKERLEALHEGGEEFAGGYDRHCRDLPAEEVQHLLDAGTLASFVKRCPLTGSTTFHDAVFGDITVENSELDDQILRKPTVIRHITLQTSLTTTRCILHMLSAAANTFPPRQNTTCCMRHSAGRFQLTFICR